MEVRYTLQCDGETIDVTPYNYDDIVIKLNPDESAGAWQLLPEINDVIIGGVSNYSQYEWLYDRLKNDKCRMVYFTYYCDAKNIRR